MTNLKETTTVIRSDEQKAYVAGVVKNILLGAIGAIVPIWVVVGILVTEVFGR